MHHSAEIAIAKYLSSITRRQGSMKSSTIKKISSAIESALNKQFNSKPEKFRLRMSSIGKPYCQLWYSKNKTETAIAKPGSFVIQMIIGDIVEAVFNGVFEESGVDMHPSEEVTLKLGKHTITGTTDPSFMPVTDTKSASPYSYQHKFTDGQTLAENDSFGYVAQGVGYAKALNKKFNGWFVVNKSSGEYKFVPYEGESEQTLSEIETKLDELEENKFRRCFSPIEETYRRKPTGNKILGIECKFCDFKFDCWENQLSEEPSRVSTAKEKPMVYYLAANV